MFSKLGLFTAVVAPLVSALTLQAPSGATSGGETTLMWSSDSGDPDTWSFELVNTVFHNAFAIANNVNPAPQQLSVLLPIVPVGDGYTLQAVNIGNITDVYATSPSFSIGGTSSSSGASGASGASTATTATTPVVTPRTTTSTTPLNTVVRSSTTPNANPSSSTSTSSIPTAASSGASRRLDFNVGGIAAAVFAIGGAAIFTL